MLIHHDTIHPGSFHRKGKLGGSVAVDFLFIVTPIVEVCNCSMFVVRYFMSILVLQSS